MTMRIGLIGAGMMAGALAGQWAAAGHEVLVGARDPRRGQELADRIGARAGTLREAARFGEVLLIAVKKDGIGEALAAIGGPDGELAGKTLIDCGNALDRAAGFARQTWDGRSLSEQIADLAPGAHVVKAFNLAHAEVWRRAGTLRYGARPLTVPIAGAEEGKPAVRQLVEDLGGAALDCGELSQTHHLEAAAILVIRHLFDGADPTFTIAFGAADGAGGVIDADPAGADGDGAR
jgi:predicted dinucleotide-binding enzyme